jgi:hypothetical protein
MLDNVQKNDQYVQLVQRSSKGSSPGNNIDSQKPNFYTELCCEMSGDAAREGAGRAIEP